MKNEKISHKSVISQLQDMGISKHEAEIYVEILRFGEASVGMILEKIPLHREQAYRALKNMEEIGLIRQFEKRKRAYFAANDPQILIKRVESKLKTAEALQSALKSMHRRSPHVVKVLEGARSFEILFEDILQTLKRNSEYLILGGQGRGFESLEGVWPFYQKNIRVFTKKNITLRMIAFEGQDFSKQFVAQPLLEVRELPGAYVGPVATVIFGNKVALEVMDPDNISIVTIENQKIADSYRQQFEALWRLGKPVARLIEQKSS